MKKIREVKYVINTNKNLNKRICLISDIHHDVDFKTSIYDELLEKIRNLKPDYITISGDVLDKGCVLEDINSRNMINSFIKSLGEITKTLIVMGNHDQRYSYTKFNDEYSLNWFYSLNKFKNVYFLNNESITFNNIDFIGYVPSLEWFNDFHKDNFYKEFYRHPVKINENNNYKIMLLHSPYSITKKINYENLPDITNNVDLILSGHMHNGVLPRFLEIRKNGRGIIAPNKKLFPKYVRGVHKIKDMNIVISRGITAFSHPDFFKKFNFLYDKEITIVDLK
jgi:predicted MPP superfamily phosphohydrolase